MKEYRRIDQWLSLMGYCSRQEAKVFLKKIDLRFQERRCLDPSEKTSCEMILNGEALDHPLGLVLIMNKPAGYVCSQNEKEGPRVFDLLPDRWQKRSNAIQTVGRLDKDTTGTLILTDQGDWLHEWSHPKIRWNKNYLVEYKGILPPDTESLFLSGSLTLPGEKNPCLPSTLERIDLQKARLILQEGRFHQVKRMFESQKTIVTRLHRESFGPWSADDLAPGCWKVIDFQQVLVDVSKYKEILKNKFNF